MTRPAQFVETSLIWFDDDIAQFRIRASNGRYSGAADCYGSHELPRQWAALLAGFPKTTDDNRELTVGTFEPGYAEGGCKLRFLVVNRRGHSKVEVTLRSDSEETDYVTFDLPIATSEIDKFVMKLKAMNLAEGASASLCGLSDMW